MRNGTRIVVGLIGLILVLFGVEFVVWGEASANPMPEAAVQGLAHWAAYPASKE